MRPLVIFMCSRKNISTYIGHPTVPSIKFNFLLLNLHTHFLFTRAKGGQWSNGMGERPPKYRLTNSKQYLFT